MGEMVQARVVISHPGRRRGEVLHVAADDFGFTNGYLELAEPEPELLLPFEPAPAPPATGPEPEPAPRRRGRTRKATPAAGSGEEAVPDAVDSSGNDPDPG